MKCPDCNSPIKWVPYTNYYYCPKCDKYLIQDYTITTDYRTINTNLNL